MKHLGDDGLIIDCFAGGGGTSVGIKNAKSRITLENDDFDVWAEQAPEEIIEMIKEKDL